MVSLEFDLECQRNALLVEDDGVAVKDAPVFLIGRKKYGIRPHNWTMLRLADEGKTKTSG